VVGSTVVVGAAFVVVDSAVGVGALVVAIDVGCESAVDGATLDSIVDPDVDEQPTANTALAERTIRSLWIQPQ
jgi:hypothetical protein